MSSPSALIKVNYLVMRCLHFGGVRGDLQEGNGCASRCQSLYFRAHKRHFCALLAFGTPVFGHSEHKIEVFVRFWPSEPPFSSVSSTKSGFLCSFTKLDVGLGHFPADRGIVAPTQPSHLRNLYYRRCTCAAAVPSAVACSRLSPVPPVLPLLPPLHLLSRFTCGAAAPAQPILPQPTAVAPA